jgi:hypothetical protein
MCIAWKPGGRTFSSVVSTVTVANPPLNSIVAFATCLPSGVASFAVSFREAPDELDAVVLTDVLDGPGAGEPVHTDGVVPGELLGFWFGLQALSARAGTARNAAATAADLTMAVEPIR